MPGVEPDVGELTARGQVGANAVRGSGLALPLADASVDGRLLEQRARARPAA